MYICTGLRCFSNYGILYFKHVRNITSHYTGDKNIHTVGSTAVQHTRYMLTIILSLHFFVGVCFNITHVLALRKGSSYFQFVKTCRLPRNLYDICVYIHYIRMIYDYMLSCYVYVSTTYNIIIIGHHIVICIKV
jgi:hypothetical protein